MVSEVEKALHVERGQANLTKEYTLQSPQLPTSHYLLSQLVSDHSKRLQRILYGDGWGRSLNFTWWIGIVCSPIVYGGLRVHKLGTFNQALLGK